MTSYDYSAPTSESGAHIRELNREIRAHCEHYPLEDDAARRALVARLLRRVSAAAYRGIKRGESGPFGAVLVDFHQAVPEVVGYGTNHVVATNDPSAHAEMTAIRDAAKRLGHTDFSNLTLITSCECCAMCASAAAASKVERIYYAATRKDAAAAGFIDDDQLALMEQGGIERHAIPAAHSNAVAAKLDGHAAAVEFTYNGQTHRFYGDAGEAAAVDLPVVRAIQAACKGLSALRGGEPAFHLPEDAMIYSAAMPHPLSLAAADWAMVGRSASQPGTKDSTHIVYLSDRPETMQLRNARGELDQVPVAEVWDKIRHPAAIHMADIGPVGTLSLRSWQRLIEEARTHAPGSVIQPY